MSCLVASTQTGTDEGLHQDGGSKGGGAMDLGDILKSAYSEDGEAVGAQQGRQADAWW